MLVENSALKAIWSAFEGNIRIMAKFSYLPNNKSYKIIYLKEEGYSMPQIAAKVLCGLSTVVRTLRRFSETNSIADRGRSGWPWKKSLHKTGYCTGFHFQKESLIQRRFWNNGLWNQMWVCGQELLEEDCWKLGYEAVKRTQNHYWLNFNAKGDWCGQGNIHYGLLKTGKRSYLVTKINFVFTVTKEVPM